jgi:hypothetical protein
MTLLPDPIWPVLLLAGLLVLDAAMSIRPPKFIEGCLSGVGLPRDWWWVLIVIKSFAATGLIVGIWVPGIALASTVGVVAYFLCAAVAHVRARFLKQEFWVNCLGFLAIAVLALVFELPVQY